MAIKTVNLDRYLAHKTSQDGHIYDYAVTPEGPTGLTLTVYRIVDEDNRAKVFSGPMHSDKGLRSSDVFTVKSPNATYKLYFFM